MRKCVGQRILLTAYTVTWLFLLLLVWCVLSESLSYHCGIIYRQMGGAVVLPSFTEKIVIPLIGGLGHTHPRMYGPNWLTYLVWGILFAWPIGNLVFVWWCRNPDKMRWGLLYSCIGYSLCLFTVAFAIVVGLSTPFMY